MPKWQKVVAKKSPRRLIRGRMVYRWGCRHRPMRICPLISTKQSMTCPPPWNYCVTLGTPRCGVNSQITKMSPKRAAAQRIETCWRN